MSRFKHGVSLLAIEKKVPVVPCYLVGLNKLRPKGTREVTPGPVWVNYQKPIYLPEGISVPDATQMIYNSLNQVHQRVLEHGPEAARWDWQP
jgi:1-acyl-sn-glycerol-3-phosphate acyltransferase